MRVCNGGLCAVRDPIGHGSRSPAARHRGSHSLSHLRKPNHTRKTDGRGSFAFTRPAFPDNCKVRAVYPNFAALELSVGRRRSFTLQLRLAVLKQTVNARADKLLSSSLSSVSLSTDDLKEISTNGEDLLAYAKLLAGITSGPDSIYVDGMPADQLPPADRIESISINADPFSTEYSDGGDTHIDISTRRTDRKFSVSSAGVSLGTRAPAGLNAGLSSTSKNAVLGFTGPVPICRSLSQAM